jgi:hypothetical protein
MGSEAAIGVFVLLAEGRGPLVVMTVDRSLARGLVVFLPSEKPIPKKTAHRITKPKNSASIFPVPSVISVSSDVDAAMDRPQLR